MKRLLSLIPVALLTIVTAAILPVPVLACAGQTSWSGPLNGDVTKSVDNVPAGAKISVSIVTSSGCVYAEGNVIVKADGDTVRTAKFNIADGDTFHASHTLNQPADELRITIDTTDVYGSITYAITVAFDGSSSVATPPDQRLNWQLGDDVAAVYPEHDAEGNPELHVYAIGEQGHGEYQFTVTLADLQPYRDNPPTENAAIKATNKAALYALDSGEFQISLGPDDEGKYYDLIFSGLPVETFKLIKWTVTDVITG